MVWAAVVLGLGWAAQLAWTMRREVYWRRIVEVKDAKIGVIERAWDELRSKAFGDEERAFKAEAKYDALVEKLRVKAEKPDDGIIHAKNSGDVRRIFEHRITQIERDKAQEN